jgi:ureidoglycolate hydrolase
MLIIVADNGPDDRPDPKTIKSFVMESNMGVSYAPGVWREYSISRLHRCTWLPDYVRRATVTFVCDENVS